MFYYCVTVFDVVIRLWLFDILEMKHPNGCCRAVVVETSLLLLDRHTRERSERIERESLIFFFCSLFASRGWCVCVCVVANLNRCFLWCSKHTQT